MYIVLSCLFYSTRNAYDCYLCYSSGALPNVLCIFCPFHRVLTNLQFTVKLHFLCNSLYFFPLGTRINVLLLNVTFTIPKYGSSLFRYLICQ